MQPSDSEEDVDLSDGPVTTNIPPTIYVMKFHPNARKESVEWLLEKIEAKQKYGGAELFVRCEPQKQDQGVVVHVSATKIKLLEIAEATELQKRTATGLIQDFSVKDLDQFLYGGFTLETILSPSEREFCVRHELEGIRAKPEDSHVPGYTELRLFPGQSIVDAYLKEELIADLFPLHDRQSLEDLANRWYKSLIQGATLDAIDYFVSGVVFTKDALVSLISDATTPQPPMAASCDASSRKHVDYLDEVRSYFGESIGMYFGFLGFYSLMLVAPAILGLAQFFFSVDSLSEYAFFAAFNLIWVTLCLELWKRRSAELAYNWGTLERTKTPEARPNYKGYMRQNPITGRYEPYCPSWKTSTLLYFISIPLVGLCIVGSLWVMVMANFAEEQLVDWKKRYGSIAGIFAHVPSAFYAVLVWLINYHFKKLATALTEWENHRTQEEYEWHRVSKLVAFELFNNFSSLFYIAFYLQDSEMLCSQVATLLIVTQMINHFKEALLPYAVKKAYSQLTEVVTEKLRDHPITSQFFVEPMLPVNFDCRKDQPVLVLSLDPKDPRIVQAKEEAALKPYKDEYDDYLEVFLQFGYVFLFASVYPLAAFWALLNNVLELKTDAFKLCRLFRKPSAKKVKNIGVWQNAFELIGAIAVVTNCALLCQSPRLRPLAPKASPVEWVLIFVFCEHVILILKLILMQCISNTPGWVKDALDKVTFHSKMILRHERGKKTRRHLSRRFRSVHGMPRSGSRSRGTTPVAQNGGVRHRNDYAHYRD